MICHFHTVAEHHLRALEQIGELHLFLHVQELLQSL